MERTGGIEEERRGTGEGVRGGGGREGRCDPKGGLTYNHHPQCPLV